MPADAGSSPAPPPVAPGRRPAVRRRADRTRVYVALGAVAVAALVVGLGFGTDWYGLVPGGPSGACPTGVTVQGAGAAFPAALISQWTDRFQSATSNLVNYAPTGAGHGISSLTDKTVDFTVTDEPLTPSEDSLLRAAVGPVLTLPVTGGSVVMIYNLPGYPGPLNLSGQDLAAIYLGAITAWDDPALVEENPGLAAVHLAMVAVHRSDAAGQSYVLTDKLSRDNETWDHTSGLGTTTDPQWPNPPGAYGASGNSAMISYVGATTGALGYTDLYDAQVKSLAIASVENPHGAYIFPTVENSAQAIADLYAVIGPGIPASTENWENVSWVNAPGAGDYPLATLVYFMVPQDPGNGHTATAGDAAVLRQWITWVVNEGQSFDTQAFPFFDPPGPLVVQDRDALDTMTFHGASFASCG